MLFREVWCPILKRLSVQTRRSEGADTGNADFLPRFPLPAVESDIHGDSALTHSNDVDIHVMGTSGPWPRLANAAPPSTLVPTPLSLLDHLLTRQKQPLNHPVSPPVPLAERTFETFDRWDP